MAHRQHIILGHPAVPQKLLLAPLSIPPEAAADEPIHPKWCQSGTLPLDSPPLGEHVTDWRALKLSTVGCQISNQFRSGTHIISCSKSSPLCQFSDWLGHSLLSAPL